MRYYGAGCMSAAIALALCTLCAGLSHLRAGMCAAEQDREEGELSGEEAQRQPSEEPDLSLSYHSGQPLMHLKDECDWQPNRSTLPA